MSKTELPNTEKLRIEKLSASLRALHRDLLMREARKLESESGKKLTPYELLNLSLNDASLAWLRHLSTLIVHIDTTLDEVQSFGAGEVTDLVERVSAVIETPGAGEAFWTKYTGYLSHDADLIMKHAALKADLAELRRMKEN